MLRKMHLYLLTPFFAFLAFFFVGCTPQNNGEINAGENVYPVSCRFENNSMVNLTYNDSNNEATVGLVVEGENITVMPVVTYNSDIISYDVTTGKITAIAPGQTSIVVSYQTSPDVYKQIFLNVCVTKAVFAQRVVLFPSYTFKLLENTPSAKINEREIISGSVGQYSGTLTYESLSPSIFSVDENGFVTPNAVGTGTIRVSAASGYDAQNGQYSYVSETAQIVVESPISQFSLDIVDSEFNALSSTSSNSKIYNLYYGKKYGSDVDNKYYFKIDCSKSLASSFLSLTCDALSNQVVSGQSLHYVLSTSGEVENEGHTIYVPFAVRDYGFEIVTYHCLDLGLNYSNNVSSNQVSFFAYAYMSELEVSCIAYAGEENVMENMFELAPSDVTGQYTLYLLGGTTADKLLGQSAGFTQYANIKFGNINLCALNKLTIEHESGVVSNFSVLDHLYRVDAQNKGQTSITLIADDESGWTKTLVFNIIYYEPTAYQFASFSGNQFSLVCGVDELSSQDLSLVSFAPSYAYIKLEIQIANIVGHSVVLVNGATVTANTAGQCYVVVTLNDSIQKRYMVTVYNQPDKIVFETPTSFSVEYGGLYQMLFTVQDSGGQVISGITLELVCYDENGDETDEFDDVIYIEFTTDGAYLQILQKGTYSLGIRATLNSDVCKKLTVVCV